MAVNLNVGAYQTQMERPEMSLRTREAGAVKSAQTPAPSMATGDKVSVSSDALLRTEAYRAAATAPDVRQEKVNELKGRVNSGDYQIDNRRIASKLVQSELALFRK